MKTSTYDETQWKFVPIEPTDEMFESMMFEWDSIGNRTFADNYKSMISVAPQPPKEKNK